MNISDKKVAYQPAKNRPSFHRPALADIHPIIPVPNTSIFDTLTNNNVEMPAKRVKLNETDTHEMTISKFSSAGGSNISYSADSLLKSKYILTKSADNITSNDISRGIIAANSAGITSNNEGLPPRSNNRDSSASSKFKTAKGSSVIISEEARLRTANLLHDKVSVNVGSTNPTVPDTHKAMIEPVAHQVTNIFQTARGKNVTFSEESRAKVSELFKLDDQLTNNNTMCTPHSSCLMGASTPCTGTTDCEVPTEVKVPPTSSLFQTARGSKVSISEDARRKSASLFTAAPVDVAGNDARSSEATTIAVESSSKPPDLSSRRSTSMFNTARGNTVTYSEEAINRSTAIFSSTATPTLLKPQLHVDTPAACGGELEVNQTVTNNSPLILRQSPLVVSDTSIALEKPEEVSSAAIDDNIVEIDEEIESDTEPLDFSRSALLSYCPCALVDASIVLETRRKRRLAAINQINSSNASNIFFDDYGNFSFRKSGILIDVFSRLSPLSSLTLDMKQWVTYQLRWIVWTLASYERKIPSLYLDKILQLENVYWIVSCRYSLYTADRKTGITVGVSFRQQQNRFLINKSGMSPLQRCCDIITLVWPLLLCLAVGSDNKYYVTDGWWWTPANLDSHLQALVKKKILEDGCKIAILSATFENDLDGPIIQLKYNCVRRARDSGKLGFIRSGHLKRGLSLSSVLVDAGPIYSINVSVIRSSPICSKLTFIEGSDSSGPPCRMSLNEGESRKLKDIIRTAEEKYVDKLESHEDLTLAAVLDYLACDESMTSIILGLEKGQEADLTDEEQRQVTDILSKVQTAKHNIASRLVQEEVKVPRFTEQIYRDVLMACPLSNQTCWLRFSVGSDGGGEHSSALAFKPGEQLTVTNLKSIRSSCSRPLLLTTPNSSITHVGNRQLEAIDTTVHSSIRHAAPLASLSEITVQCVIIDYNIVEETPISCLYNIVATDQSRAVLVLRYMVPTLLASRMDWLEVNNPILVKDALIQHYDSIHDILLCSRGDHTTVQTCSVPIPSSLLSYFLDSICEMERRRYRALCNGKSRFVLPGSSAVEDCARFLYSDVSIALPHIRDPNWNAEISLSVYSIPPLSDLRMDTCLLHAIYPNVGLPELVFCDVWITHQLDISLDGSISVKSVAVHMEPKSLINKITSLLNTLASNVID